MGIEQTNFLHIFDEEEVEKKLDLSNFSAEVIDDGENDLIADKSSEKKEYLISESLIAKEKEIKKEAERKLKRLLLLRENNDIPLLDFEEIMPEIKAYEIRLSMLRAIYEEAKPGQEKERAYQRLVNPDMHDDEIYRDSARLYLKYLEAVKLNKKQQGLVIKIKAKRGKKKDLLTNSQVEEDADSESDDKPDPYGDIYPYSRNLR